MSLLSVRIVLASLSFMALTRCDGPTAPLPREGAPDEFRFVYGGFTMEAVTVELEGTSVAMWRTSWDWRPGVAIDTIRSVPTEAAWREFWVAAERAGVRRWRPRYAAEGVLDGDGWTLRLAAGDFRLTSTGSNAYPDALGREHELEMTEAFQSFRSALGNLIGEDL